MGRNEPVERERRIMERGKGGVGRMRMDEERFKMCTVSLTH